MNQPGHLHFDSHAVALTIAGSDPSGGAGLQADLKTFQQLGVYGMSVITLLTVQNTRGVTRVELIPLDLVAQQLIAVLEDIRPQAIKIGALGSVEIVQTVASLLARVDLPIVIDPVLVSKHGHSLASDQVAQAIAEHLLPLATLVTPNRFEAERLSGKKLDSEAGVETAVAQLHHYGAQYVLIKLGEVAGQSAHLLSGPELRQRIETPRVLQADNTHGTGCILAAAITAYLSLGQGDIHQCVHLAIDQVYRTVACNSHLGQGIHPAETRAIGRHACD